MARPAMTAHVITNRRCNQRCGYCDRRRPSDDLASISFNALTTRIDAELAAGARDIQLSGGEPTMRGDLERLVAHARQAGAERVTLETNATLIDAARARALAEAGLTLARVNLAGTDDRLDQITADPGGFRRTVVGIRALADAGIALDILCTLTRSTSPLVAELPAFVAPFAVRAIELVVPTDGPDPAELLSYTEVAAVAVKLELACRTTGVSLRASPADAPPPCVLPSRLSHLFSLGPEDVRDERHRHLPACDGCLLQNRCAGVALDYLRHHPIPSLTPIVDDRIRRRLSLIGTVPEQIARELVSTSLSADPDGKPVVDEIIRVNFLCNQACDFCFVSTHLPTAADALVAKAIGDAAARGSRIVISGGEPTLHKRLVEWVALAREKGGREVSLQTNAVRLDDPALVDALVAAGLGETFVSLHGSTADVSDHITGTPGTFVRTLVGLDNLHRTRVPLRLNFVICESNRHELPDVVRLIARRWPRAGLNVSFVAASTDLVPRTAELMPRYSTALPQLTEALAEAARLGVEIHGLESMCGIPLCLLPPSVVVDTLSLTEIPAGFDRGEFVRAKACGECRFESRCYGMRRQYAELYGTAELVAIP